MPVLLSATDDRCANAEPGAAHGGPYPMLNGRFERLCRLRFSGQQRHDAQELRSSVIASAS